jgi:hypothetical protein
LTIAVEPIAQADVRLLGPRLGIPPADGIFENDRLSVPTLSAGTTDATNRRRLVISVPEAQSRRGSDVVVLDEGVCQAAIVLRAHEADVDIPLSNSCTCQAFIEEGTGLCAALPTRVFVIAASSSASSIDG